MKASKIRKFLLTILLVSPLVVANENSPKRNNAGDDDAVPTQHNEATVARLQAEMASGRLTSVELTKEYIKRIIALDQNGSGVNAVIELNPDALAMARAADEMREHGHVLGPLHGIPVLVKDNVDTGDKMQTTAGSFALAGMPALHDSTVAAKLRAGGAVILGKTNLSEWANFRSFESISGWSGRGGQTNNPYGISRNPCGSSSGSGAAVSANFATVSFGTETDGSIVCPANANGVVGIKPTVGLTSRAGIVPISHTQDTFGPHGRTVADAAAALSVVQSLTFDPRDPATGGVPLGWQGTGKTRPTNIPTDYTQFVNPNGLQGAKLGLTRTGLSGFTNVTTPAPVTASVEAAFKALGDAGATVVDLDAAGFTFSPPDGEFFVLLYDFKMDIANYFGTRVGVPVAGGTLADGIAFNNAHTADEMSYFNQDIWDLAETMNPDPNFCDPRFTSAVLPTTATCMSYNDALKIDHLAGVKGIDAALAQFNLDAVVSATDNPAWATDLVYGDHFIYGTSGLAAAPGYPIVQVPAGFPELCASTTQPTNCTSYGVPLGISFFGTAFSEPTLIKLASGFEAFTQVRAHNLPTFSRTVPFDHINGTTLQPPHSRGMSSEVNSSNAKGIAAPAPNANQVKQQKETRRPHRM